jgi:CHASE3 domain sensor protein
MGGTGLNIAQKMERRSSKGDAASGKLPINVNKCVKVLPGVFPALQFRAKSSPLYLDDMPTVGKYLPVLSRPAVTAGLTLVLGLTVGLSLLVSLSPKRFADADQRAQGAQQTLTDAARLLGTMNDAESMARRYLLTGELTELTAFGDAQQRYPIELGQLHRGYLSRNDGSGHFTALQEALATHFTHLQNALASAASNGAFSGLTSIESDSSDQVRSQILSLIQALQQAELSALANTSAVVAQRAESIQALNIGLIVLAATLTATGAWLVIRRVREIENLITVCAWTRQVRWRGHWISFEEYLAKRFRLHCTHGICEEAAEKLLVESNSASPFGSLSPDSSAPFSSPPFSSPPFSTPPFSAPPFSAPPFRGTPFPGKSTDVHV